MKKEKGITLTVLVIYVIIFTTIIGLLANLSSYIYGNIKYINDNSIDISEFNKFNMYFIKDVKTNSQAIVKENSDGNEGSEIIFEDGNIYKYIKNEKTIYKNKQKIAENIQNFSAEIIDNQDNSKKYIKIYIKIGAEEETNYENEINYVLKYW